MKKIRIAIYHAGRAEKDSEDIAKSVLIKREGANEFKNVLDENLRRTLRMLFPQELVDFDIKSRIAVYEGSVIIDVMQNLDIVIDVLDWASRALLVRQFYIFLKKRGDDIFEKSIKDFFSSREGLECDRQEPKIYVTSKVIASPNEHLFGGMGGYFDMHNYEFREEICKEICYRIMRYM